MISGKEINDTDGHHVTIVPYLQVSVNGGIVQWEVVLESLCVDIRAGLQELSCDIHPSVITRFVQRRPPLKVTRSSDETTCTITFKMILHFAKVSTQMRL